MKEITNPHPSSHHGKTALVTGGSRGIGRAIVERLSADGAKVFFTFLRQVEAAAEVATKCGAVPIQCDQEDAPAVDLALERILKHGSGLDILVNNAGIKRDQFLMLMPDYDWHSVIDTNLGGAFRWCKAVSRQMLKARRGTILNVASISGLVGVAGQTNYAASKGGLIALTRALASELGVRGIRVNAIAPGFIETDMTAAVPEEIRSESLKRITLKRFGKAAEIAAVASFLCSDAASYITGQCIVVDGGLTGAPG
jgi:3-oxoacyl-[acyl-carrier protein] reductase